MSDYKIPPDGGNDTPEEISASDAPANVPDASANDTHNASNQTHDTRDDDADNGSDTADDSDWDEFPDEIDFSRPLIDAPQFGRPKRRRFFPRFLQRFLQRPWTLPERVAAAALVWLALGAALLAAFGRGTGLDAVRRYLHYGATAHRVYSYPSSGTSRFARVGDNLLILTDNSLRIFGPDGAEIWAQSVRMSEPALSGNGNRVAAWDVGGSELYVMGENGPLKSLKADDGAPFLSARLNQNGWLAVTSGRQGYKGAVSVYDANMKLAFEFHSSRRFVTDALVLNDNSRLAAVTLGQEDSVFVSDIVYYRLDREEAEGHCELPDALAMELTQDGATLCAACDSCFARLSFDGPAVARYDFGDAWLREYDLGGDGFAALYLSLYQSGAAGRLVTVDSNGNEIGSLDMMEEIADISAAGRYVAALYTDRLVVYNQALEVYATLEDAGNVQSVIMRPDGSALLLGGTSARLFLP